MDGSTVLAILAATLIGFLVELLVLKMLGQPTPLG